MGKLLTLFFGNEINQLMNLFFVMFESCVTNDKLISPFRGTYNTENGNQVSLYSYLKAFRFTGSPALYLECDIHMCHNRCPVSVNQCCQCQ